MTRFVEFLNADVFVQIASLAAIDMARFATPVRMSLSPLLMSRQDHLDIFVDIFVAKLLNLGISRAAPVSVSKAPKLFGAMYVCSEGVIAIREVPLGETNSQCAEPRTILIVAAYTDVTD